MAELVYQRAGREAQRLLEEHWNGRLQVQLKQFSRELGVEAYRADLGEAISGVVSKIAGKRAVIVVNSAESEPRRRFTLAHELGHVIERAVVANDDEYSFRDMRKPGKYDLHEFFADEFAGALLMPDDHIRRMKDEGLAHSQMASEFDVSVSALRKRLARLKKNE